MSLGTNVAGLMPRSVEECLNCEKDDCKGCMADRSEALRQAAKRYRDKCKAMGGCTYCNGKTIAIKAETLNNGVTLRRRQCKVCGKIFRTVERPIVSDEEYKRIRKENRP